MATTIINPPANNDSGNNGLGFLLGIIMLIVFAVIFVIYGIPYIRDMSGGGGVQVNVPDSVDVNINETE